MLDAMSPVVAMLIEDQGTYHIINSIVNNRVFRN